MTPMGPHGPAGAPREELIRDAARLLRDSGSPSPRLDAELLMAAALGCDRLALVRERDCAISADGERAFAGMVQRRRRGEPVAYILGAKEFYGREFAVDRRVLIPRPETELLVEAALEEIRSWRRTSMSARRSEGSVRAGAWRDVAGAGRNAALAGVRRILDLGSGSGAIGVTLAAEMDEADREDESGGERRASGATRIVCSDVSLDALRVARANAIRHRVAGSVDFVAADGLEAFRTNEAAAAGNRGRAFHPATSDSSSSTGWKNRPPLSLADRRSHPPFDLIVSNPPYVGRDEAASLAPDVRDFEPELALFAGPAGLEFIDRLLAQAPARLKPGALLAFEIGYRHGADIVERARRDAAWVSAECRQDLAGHDRVILLRRR